MLNATFDEFRKESIETIKPGAKDISELDDSQRLRCWDDYLQKLLKLKILDLAAGSGAFLVECYKILIDEVEKYYDLTKPLRTKIDSKTVKTFYDLRTHVLNECLFGKDILNEAISVAKLSLWYITAKKNVKFPELESTMLHTDSLGKPENFKANLEMDDDYQQFDIIVGNPPWGATVHDSSLGYLKQLFPELDIKNMDSFELFLLVALKHLKVGGRISYVLPYSILYPEKKQIRRILLSNTTIERWDSLGAEWFGTEIRMNTVVLQLKKQIPCENPLKYILNQMFNFKLFKFEKSEIPSYSSFTLVGEERKQAIQGKIDLQQFEIYSFPVSQARSLYSEETEVELFRYERDDEIMQKMESNSLQIRDVCDSYRGVEMNKNGDIIQCPSCFKWDVPPRKQKGRDLDGMQKECKHCKGKFLVKNAYASTSIIKSYNSKNWCNVFLKTNERLYLDGDSFEDRYMRIEYDKKITLGYDGIDYKDDSLYKGPKIFIRQAGVGIHLVYDESDAYCPQSIYFFKVKDAYKENIHPLFILAVIHSRAFSYYVFKKYGELDAAQAFSKLTMGKIEGLPLPIKDRSTASWKKTH
ncbi:MAG: N-6 DNA methylase, partial [Candidatus Sigynarchaeota archaeon]